MVINIVSPHASYYLGGMEVVTLQMARYLAKNGNAIRFFTRKTNTPTDIFQQLVAESGEYLEIIEVPLPETTPLADSTWPTFYRITCDFGVAAQPYYQKYSDADFFVTHLSVDTLFTPKDSRTILHLHGTPSVTDPLMEAALALPNLTVAHSESIKEWWSNNSALNPRVFQNGIDTLAFTGEVTAERPIDILYVGRFMEHKGVDDVLRAARANQTIAVAGNGPYLNELKAIARDRGIENSVTFYDTPSTATIQQLYQQAKVFACPSRGREGVLTTLLEAGASGCAVVTASGSGMTDIIKDGVNGVVVAPGDVAHLEKAFDSLLQDTEQRISLAQALQAEIRERWSWDSKARQLEEIYRETR